MATSAEPGGDRLVTVGHCALVATVVATVVAVPLGSQANAGSRLALTVVASVAFGALLVVEARRPFLTVRRVGAGAFTLLVVAVAVPPQGSADLWSYAAYGRMVAHYGRSPYRADPDDVGPDAVTARVAPAWKGTKSVYGPVFVAVAAGGSAIARSSPAANRLFWQGLAAAAVAVSLFVLTRQGADSGALAFIGLNPAIVLGVINGGHNDALVGLCVVAAAALAHRRPGLAGAVLAVGALVKLVALLPLAALVVWAWRRGERAGAARAVAAGSTILGASYWLAGGRVALRPVLALGAAHSRASISTFAANVHPALGAPVFSALVVAAVALAVVLGPRRPPLPLLLGSVLVAYLAGTPYVLPWYVMWALPALALDWRSPVAAMGAVAALGLTVAYLGAPRLHDGFLRMVVHPVYAVALPLFFAASLAWLVARSRQASGRTGPILDTGGSQIGAAH